MTLLAPEADRAVRDAVEAFLAGALRPSMLGETMFETRNGRYRLMDGVLFSAADTSMVGAELVGWLLEGPENSVVQDGWIAGARAVLVDRRRSRQIIVTSTSRLFRVDATGSGAKPMPLPPPSTPPPRAAHAQEPSTPSSLPPPSTPPASVPAPSSTHGPLTPRRPIPPCPPAPIGRLPGTTELSVATALIRREPSYAGAPPLALPPPPASGRDAPVTRAATPVHPPPRPTGKHPKAVLPSMGRPLPAPVPPPAKRAAPPQEPEELDGDDPTVPHARDDLPLPPPASGLRRSSSASPRKASQRGLPLA
ncbi:MAG TPA: hypothetical protein VHB21_10175 [Minicystis sp.]|nr:hypothetical protein [Minicystis sp.]